VTIVLRARWILPIDQPPIRDGWIEMADGHIVAIGAGRAPAEANDRGNVAVLPGLVNAHTHLELSWMAGRIAPSASMDAWIHRLMELRRSGAPGGRDGEVLAARRAAASMREAGTVLVGDVSNTAITPRLLEEAGLGGTVFHELLGFNHLDPLGAVREAWARIDALDASRTSRSRLSHSVVAHAPYSVSPALFRAIAAARREAPLSVHLAESPAEIEFLRTGQGPIRQMLESLGVWSGSWPIPRCTPVRYLDDLGYLAPGTLIVHGVYLTDDELDRLRDAGAILVTCPRSNLWVGAGPPRLAHFYAEGLPVAIGTDSLASVASLSLFDELAEIRRLAPEVAAGRLLESATRIGAEALGFGAEYGTLAPHKRAALVEVDVPAGVTDVEEYLVSGVRTDRVRRLNLNLDGSC
jgi:cytosine/adenosine deaminase-related metal-dependent hydrolase